MTIRLIVPGDLHDAPEDAVLQQLAEDLERPSSLVHAALQHEEDGIGVEDEQIEDERRGEKSARRQSYAEVPRRICPGTICG